MPAGATTRGELIRPQIWREDYLWSLLNGEVRLLRRHDTENRGRSRQAHLFTRIVQQRHDRLGQPVLEKKLHEAGIYFFWQVAALKEEQITELEEEMSFPGRITRDEWVKQAEEFAKDA